MELKLTQYGAGREVGRSCIGLTFSDKTKLLLDAGSKFVKITKNENGKQVVRSSVVYPDIEPSELKKVRMAILSHSHLDHVGALPYFVSQGLDCPIVSNELTRRVSEVLLEDAFRIDKKRGDCLYGQGHLARVINHLMQDPFDMGINGFSYELKSSGHIPGSSSIPLKYENIKIFYTSDINHEDSLLLNGADRFSLADIMIIDSTYGDGEHDSRDETIEAFKNKVIEVLARGGSIVIGVFGVARAQEVMIFLDELFREYDFNIPVYLDGMAREITDIYLDCPDENVNVGKLRRSNDWIKRIESRSDRSYAIQEEQAIYLATSGMFSAGPVLDFLQGIASDSKSAVILTGYQAHGTGGEQLLREARIALRQSRKNDVTGKTEEWTKTVDVKCEIKKYGLSAHSDIEGLGKIIRYVNPKYLVAQHGDSNSIDAIMEFVEKMEFPDKRLVKTYGPSNGDELIFNL